MKYEIITPQPGQKLDVLPLLRHPQDFHGDTQVDCLIKFGPGFEGLIGIDDKPLVKDNVVVLEHHDNQAKKLMDKINDLAQQIIKDPAKYDDLGFCQEYLELARVGYKLLAKYQPKGIPVSLERAGLVTTRLVLGLDQDAQIDEEVAVVTKRTHLKDEQETYLAVTVKWRDLDKLKAINNQEILLSDFVNPASGASGLAFLIAAGLHGVKPSQVNHWSISLTRQGVALLQQVLGKMNIKASFHSVGECNQLNQMYYLIGQRAVADAGQVLRHFLPKWYQA